MGSSSLPRPLFVLNLSGLNILGSTLIPHLAGFFLCLLAIGGTAHNVSKPEVQLMLGCLLVLGGLSDKPIGATEFHDASSPNGGCWFSMSRFDNLRSHFHRCSDH